MLAPARPALSPVVDDDLGEIGDFLHRHLNQRVSARAWVEALRVPWAVDAPNHGFQLTVGDRVVGVQLAFYSTRIRAGGEEERICNLAAWCVEEEYRAEGLRLLRAALAQRGYTFTDLSPSGNVVALNARLGFERVDQPTSLTVALPWSVDHGTRITTDPRRLEESLQGREHEIYRDHRNAAAAHHALIERAGRRCHVIWRRDTRKGLRCFATILYASDPAVLRAAWRPFTSHLLRRHAVAGVLVEDHIVGVRPPRAVIVERLQRPRMARRTGDQQGPVDYLYSELTCVAW